MNMKKHNPEATAELSRLFPVQSISFCGSYFAELKKKKSTDYSQQKINKNQEKAEDDLKGVFCGQGDHIPTKREQGTLNVGHPRKM